MDALVMCGGRGTRLDTTAEKPLYEIGGRPMIDRVCDALNQANVETVWAVTSPAVPETRAHLGESRARIIDGNGDGYVADLQQGLSVTDDPVLTVTADLPLLDRDAINRVLDRYSSLTAQDMGTQPPEPLPSLTVCVPLDLKEDLGVSVDSESENGAVPCGVNVVSRGSDAVKRWVVRDPRFAVNVNYQRDAVVAANRLSEDPKAHPETERLLPEENED